MNPPLPPSLEKLLELSVDLLSVASSDGTFRWVNPAFTRTLGWSAEELTSRPFMEFVHPDDVAATLAELESVRNGKNVVLFENRYRTSSGDYVWLQWNSRVDGNDVFSTTRVITERKQADELSRIRRRYLEMAEQMADVGHWHLDVQSSRANWSDQVWRIHGLEPGDRPALEDAINYYHPEDRPIVQEHVRRAIEEKRAFEFELRLQGADGVTRIVDTLGRPEFNDRGEVTGVFGVFRDVTARVESQRELEREKRKLQQFVRVASHDLQEPLRMVASYMALLNENYADRLDERGKRFVSYATEGASRMKTLVDDVLAFSRSSRHTPQLQDVSLDRILQEVLDDLALYLNDHNAEVRMPEELPTVHSDAVLLRLILQNLLSNAIKFSRPGVAPVCAVEVTGEGRQFVLTLSDNGIGIPKDRIGRIFEPFERLHHRDEYAGNGIGLAIVADAVEALHGDLDVTSTVGEGTTFEIVFT
ncbi:MAG: PAS domain-containing protein [Myxococcota bacterium]